MADEKETKKTPDVVLDDGREITFDLRKISVKEWREFVRATEWSIEEDDALLARVSGISPDDIPSMNYVEYRRLTKAFGDKTRDPLGTTG